MPLRSDAERPAVLWRLPLQQQELLTGLDSLPKYIKIVRWVKPSQGAVMCHPSVVLFVTHGGINSPQEAINCAVPLVIVTESRDALSALLFFPTLCTYYASSWRCCV